MQINKKIAIGGIIALIIILGSGLYLSFQPKPITLQGQIEAREYNISSKIPGRVDDIFVQKGDKVAQGDLLFTINSPELNAKLMQAQGGREAARAMAKEANKGARKQQITAAKEQWLKAKAASNFAYATFERIESLFKDGVIARQKRDEAYTRWQGAKFTEQAAFAMYQMAEEGAREETKAAAKGNVIRAEGAVKEVNAILADAQMRSIHGGEVTDVLLQKGELAPSGFPVVSVLDMNDAWAVFHVREDALFHFKMDQIINVEIPAIKQTLPFKVSHIGVMGHFATWRATEAGHDYDLRTFEVELTPQMPIHHLRVGMTTIIHLSA